MKFATLLTLSSVYMNSIFKCTTMGAMIPKEMKYNLYYSKVRGDVLPPTYGTNTSLPFETKNTPKNENRKLGLIKSLLHRAVDGTCPMFLSHTLITWESHVASLIKFHLVG